MATQNPSLAELLKPEFIVDLKARTKPEALSELSELISDDPSVLDREAFHKAIVRREAQVSTGVGMGIAIPHVKIAQVTDYVVAVGRVKDGLDFEALDGQPVYLIFMIGASDHQTREFVKLLAEVTHLLKPEAMRRKLLEAEIPGAFLDLIRSHER